MNDLYIEALRKMMSYFDSLFVSIDAPKLFRFNDGYIYRYENSTISAAILQKLARVLTGLQASQILNLQGFIQEQASMQRVVDELSEDVMFLVLSIINNEHTDLHKRYLEAFYEEEFDEGSTAMESSQKRPMISRQKIRAYIGKYFGDQSTGINAGRTISKAYSGYLHGASPHIMELYYGKPPTFHLQGAKDSPFYQDHTDDLLNQYYRSIVAFACAAKAFGNADLCNEISNYSKDFARRSGVQNI